MQRLREPHFSTCVESSPHMNGKEGAKGIPEWKTLLADWSAESFIHKTCSVLSRTQNRTHWTMLPVRLMPGSILFILCGQLCQLLEPLPRATPFHQPQRLLAPHKRHEWGRKRQAGLWSAGKKESLNCYKQHQYPHPNQRSQQRESTD